MCSIGDIILVESYSHNGHSLTKHSFVVLNNEAGTIEGLDYIENLEVPLEHIVDNL